MGRSALVVQMVLGRTRSTDSCSDMGLAHDRLERFGTARLGIAPRLSKSAYATVQEKVDKVGKRYASLLQRARAGRLESVSAG